MQQHNIALMHLRERNARPGDRELVDQHGNVFDRQAYARFKYGLVHPGLDYGYALAAMIRDNPALIDGKHPTIIVSAPYKAVPTASHVIARALCEALAVYFVCRGLEPPTLEAFAKTQVGSAAYASSTEAERLAELANLGLRIDPAVVRDANVLAVDDIRITGTAERTTMQHIEPMEPHSVWYLHAASMAAGIPASIENELNQSFSHSLSSIIRDIMGNAFVLNSRVLRFILEQCTVSEAAFRDFLMVVPAAFVGELMFAVIGRGLKYVSDYADAFRVIKDVANRRSLAMAQILASVNRSIVTSS